MTCIETYDNIYIYAAKHIAEKHDLEEGLSIKYYLKGFEKAKRWQGADHILYVIYGVCIYI